MAANYYRNEHKYFVEIPIYTNGSITVNPGEFVQGSAFARQATLGVLVDKGAGVPAEVTADPTLLVFVQDENAGEVVGASIQTDEIDNLAVTTGKIDDLAVTTGKIAAKAVTTAKIADNAVTDAQLPVAGITAIKLDPTSSGCTVTVSAAGLKITVP